MSTVSLGKVYWVFGYSLQKMWLYQIIRLKKCIEVLFIRLKKCIFAIELIVQYDAAKKN